MPDVEVLQQAVAALSPQVGQTVVVDNTPNEHAWQTEKLSEYGVHTVLLGQNRGVAAAHNIGISWARRNGFGHVLLMDQDSIPAPEMVEYLSEAFDDLNDKYGKVAAVGPSLIDKRNGRAIHFIGRGQIFRRRIYCEDSNKIVEVTHLITSGTFTSTELFEKTGFLDESLFIEYVDIEWCLRAASMGYAFFGVCPARLYHSLGDNIVAPRMLARRYLTSYPALRYYYQFRNAMLLSGRKYIPIAWRVKNIIMQVIAKMFACLIFMPGRYQNLRMMTIGIIHGLKGIAGPYSF